MTTPAKDPVGSFRPGLFEGQVAVITGGGQGIGKATAQALASLGAKVAIAQRSKDVLEETEAELSAAGGECIAVATDVREVEQVEHLRDRTVEAFGGVDFVINNAGGQFPVMPSAISDRAWRSVVDLNLNGTWNMCSRFMRPLAERGYGTIVNMAHDFVFERGATLFAHSGAARAGVISLTKSLAPYLGAYGVTVNAIAPGTTNTAGFIKHEGNAVGITAANLDAAVAETALPRVAEAEEIAAAIVFLCSPAARYVNGATLVVDGGFMQMNWPSIDRIPFEDLFEDMPAQTPRRRRDSADP